MKKHLLKALLVIGMFCVSLFVMSAETVTGERQSFKQQQEQTFEKVSVDLLNVGVFNGIEVLLTINKVEVEISYGNLIKNDKDNLNKQDVELSNFMKLELFIEKREIISTQKTKAFRLDLKKSGTDTYIVYLENDILYKLRAVKNIDIVKTKDEVRIRGRPIANKTI